MTTIAIASILMSNLPTYSTCISHEAQGLQAIVEAQRNPHSSVLLGEAFWRLNEACLEARTLDWDGEGGLPVKAEAYRKAKALLDVLPIDVPSPEIRADADGDIVLEWSSAPRCVFGVVVRENGFLDYSGIFGLESVYGTEVFVDELPEALVRGLERFLSRSAAVRGS